jgi:hypothetical protein
LRFSCFFDSEDDNYDDYDEDEEYEEYDEDAEEDTALTKKREEEKKAAAQKAAPKKAAAKPKADPAPKKVAAEPAPSGLSLSEQQAKNKEANRKMNYELSAELFGGIEVEVINRPSITLPNGQTFETFQPKTEDEFDIFAQYVGEHLAISSVRKNNIFFLKKKKRTAILFSAPMDLLSPQWPITIDLFFENH